MKSITPYSDSEAGEVLKATRLKPSVSILLPFNTRINLGAETAHRLRILVQKVKNELLKNYTAEQSDRVIESLQLIVNKLEPDPYKKSIAIFVSPVFQKVLYLDIAVDEKVVIDSSFEVRDLVYEKKQASRYLLLVLSYSSAQLFIGDANNLIRLPAGVPEHIDGYVNEIPERIANFSDPGERKEVLLEKYLRHIDRSLAELLNEHHLPLFVAGPEKVLGRFLYVSKKPGTISGVVHGNYEEATETELKAALNPELANWRNLRQQNLLHRLEEAAGQKCLVAGINKVWKEALARRGKLLVIEKDFMYPCIHNGDNLTGASAQLQERNEFIYDAVDDIIEIVLTYGGDVEFTEPGVLAAHNRIALICYY